MTQQPTSLDEIISHLVSLQPSSREDMKQQISDVLAPYDMALLDTHNTLSMLFNFKLGSDRYGLKIEFGEAQVTRDEAHWYELAPEDLKTHHIVSHSGDHFAFVLLRWLENAKTVEEIAIENEGKDNTVALDLLIQALNQDKELFESNQIVPLTNSQEHSFFFDKYNGYNAKATDYPYLHQLLAADQLVVNGQKLLGPNKIVNQIQQDDKLRDYLSPDRAGLIHGDPHADNLLVADGRVFLLDPKGVDNLPFEYDTGRILWTLTGWNAIMRGEYDLKKTAGEYELTYTARSQYDGGLARLRDYLGERDYHRAMYSCCIQYLTRSAHVTAEQETKALYLRGLVLLHELLDEIK